MMFVSAGLPGKIRVVLDGAEYSLDQSLSLYTGLHELAARVNDAASQGAESPPQDTAPAAADGGAQ